MSPFLVDLLRSLLGVFVYRQHLSRNQFAGDHHDYDQFARRRVIPGAANTGSAFCFLRSVVV